MSQPNKHRGTIVPMVTPFTKELSLDETAAERMVDRLASHGIGAFVMGTTGEAASIPSSLRNRFVEIAVKAAAGRVPVYAGIGDNCVLNSIDAANAYLTIGVDAVVAHLPSYYTLTAGEMVQYFQLLSDQINGAIVPYNIPPATHMSIPIEVVKTISDWDNVVGFKDSENLPGRLEAIATLGNRDDFSIFMGVARNSLEAMRHGYDGLVPSSGNLAPHLWQTFEKQVEENDWDAAQETQQQANELAQIFQKDRTLGQSLATLKACMAALGLCQHYMLPPLETRPSSEIESFKPLLEAFEELPTGSSKKQD
ncbi:dihydrodipicolinate synthase family protein [Pelagicoccus sp. NFK12]|uniref:Dihydrodipicolinate synthase family protein n=1 Tax=Pelagicoccus enzymogenes TaxID=2773457 RepID=A0A927F8Q7_9BACT|nr:dihydrodipicolinate synthase family protein [Pelagicoccus enzymogenes]MBD5780399.1 dihydrodipicolinate synthase family protein [Pelagicoccus enzymogenes]